MKKIGKYFFKFCRTIHSTIENRVVGFFIVCLKWVGGLSVLAFMLFLVMDYCCPFSHQIAYSQIVTDKQDNIIHANLSQDEQWRIAVEVDEVIPLLQESIISKEDKWFFYHPGVNPVALLRALIQNVVAGTVRSGASTITMQVARMLNRRPRTMKSKLIEIFRAFQLEYHLSKDDIFCLYLNLLPYGGNIEGMKSAALLYFGQKPGTLSPAQIATLTVIPNDPNALRPGVGDSLLFIRRQEWIQKMWLRGLIDKRQYLLAMEEPLMARRRDAPALAPHFAREISKRYPLQHLIASSLDMELQSKIETLVKRYVLPLKHTGIENGAALVIDNTTRQVIAYLGSDDFYDGHHSGQVNGIEAVRSPGSTLKPLLYALALDSGLITPASRLLDIPSGFGGYEPQNYLGHYQGLISAENALALSKNVPAVKLLERYGYKNFVDVLGRAGLRTVKASGNKLGLSVILGGCGATLFELTGIYSALANNGQWTPLKWLRQEDEQVGDTLISASAAFMTTQILTRLQRPDLPGQYQNVSDLPRVAWKTGTSFGRRDAWSIGYNPHFTVGVWVGNFPGKGVPGLNGAQHATPLLFKIFEALPEYDKSWFNEPEGLSHRLVCANSGLLPSQYCDNLIEDFFIPGISATQRCDCMKEVLVSSDSSRAFCVHCCPETGYFRKLYRNLPAPLIAYYEANHIPYDNIPLHNEKCLYLAHGNAPVITSLTDGAEYLFIRGENQQCALSCAAENGVNVVYWYVNDVYVGMTKPTEPLFFSPTEGRIKVSCVDDCGRSRDIYVQISYIG